jgi:pimeloyl-ACP methyl ester carboxylesterase
MERLMQLILLPGLDGTGELFRPLLPYLGQQARQVLPLPRTASQGYADLTNSILAQLPKNEDFVLLGESFSGALALKIANQKPLRLRGVIVVAGFYAPPNPWLLAIARCLPLGLIPHLPLSTWILRYFGFERSTPMTLVREFGYAFSHAGSRLIHQRIRAVQQLALAPIQPVDIPCLLIQAERDKLVNLAAQRGLHSCCPHLQLACISAPHLVLQTRPQESTQHILQFIADVGETPGRR